MWPRPAAHTVGQVQGLRRTVAAFLIGVTLAGCDLLLRAEEPAPATVVRITADREGITLVPASVPAGRVGLEVVSGEVVLIRAMPQADGVPMPLDEAALERLMAGDMQGMTLEEVQGPSGGRVMGVDLSPGRYALAVLPPDGVPGMPPLALAILDAR